MLAFRGMRIKRKSIIAAIVAALGLAACGGALAGTSDQTKQDRVEAGIAPIDRAEAAYVKRHGLYTDRFSDLIPFLSNNDVQQALRYGVTLEVGSDQRSYDVEGAYVHSGSKVITVLHANGGRDVAFTSPEEAPDNAGAYSTRYVSSRPIFAGRGSGTSDEETTGGARATGESESAGRGSAAGEGAHGGGGEGGGGHGGGGGGGK